MSSLSQARRVIAIALIALGVSVQAAESPAAGSVREKAKKGQVSTTDMKKLVEEASRQRDAMIADYEALAKQLKDATEEQKKAIKVKMEEQKKAFEEVMNALHTQIRDEQRRQRQNAGPGKR